MTTTTTTMFSLFSPTLLHPPNLSSSLSLKPRTTQQPLPLSFSCKKRLRRAVFLEAKIEDLEDEIYSFMEESPNPNSFPTREQLVDAGRRDLAEAIAREGGWMALGWDLEEREDDHRRRFESGSLASSSGRSAMEDVEVVEDKGVEGILKRLERERSLAFGKEVDDRMSRRSAENGSALVASKSTAGSFGKCSRDFSSESGEEFFHKSSGVDSHEKTSADVNGTSSMPDTWRIWSLQRAGNPVTKFEAAEIYSDEDGEKIDHDILRDVSMDGKLNEETWDASKSGAETKDSYHDTKGTSQNHIRLRLQHLESELTSALHLLQSKSDIAVSHKGQGSSLMELHNLSDAWEFKQTEIMNARDKLRSTRAKLAVLEGKMALQIIEAQKILEEKKKRLDVAKKALHFLRSACIIWPNSASEVLLAGSFDGWTSQRRMERSNAGIFSLHLKLYPGRYEIKFIVDGVWTVDPLRPTVHNDGHVNNLLVISSD